MVVVLDMVVAGEDRADGAAVAAGRVVVVGGGAGWWPRTFALE